MATSSENQSQNPTALKEAWFESYWKNHKIGLERVEINES